MVLFLRSIKSFCYITENESKQPVLGWNTSLMVLLDLMKPYDNMDHGKPLQILEGYRMGLKIRGLLGEFWSLQEVVTPQNRFQGPQLQATRGTT